MADPERIAQHKHCFVCSRAHTGDGRFCSEACKDKKAAELKKKKKQLLVIWVIAAAILIGALLLSGSLK